MPKPEVHGQQAVLILGQRRQRRDIFTIGALWNEEVVEDIHHVCDPGNGWCDAKDHVAQVDQDGHGQQQLLHQDVSAWQKQIAKKTLVTDKEC